MPQLHARVEERGGEGGREGERERKRERERERERVCVVPRCVLLRMHENFFEKQILLKYGRRAHRSKTKILSYHQGSPALSVAKEAFCFILLCDCILHNYIEIL